MKTYIKQGWGFDVGQNFARAVIDTPIELSEKEHSGSPRFAIGYIAAIPSSTLGFLRIGDKGRIRVRVDRASLGQFAAPVPMAEGAR